MTTVAKKPLGVDSYVDTIVKKKGDDEIFDVMRSIPYYDDKAFKKYYNINDDNNIL